MTFEKFLEHRCVHYDADVIKEILGRLGLMQAAYWLYHEHLDDELGARTEYEHGRQVEREMDAQFRRVEGEVP